MNKIAQYTIRTPEAALLPYPTKRKEILWKHRLGNYEDDVKLRGLRLRKITEGWAYDVTFRGTDICRGRIRVLDGYDRRLNKPKFKERDIQEGDWYVKFIDGSWAVMNTEHVAWHERKIREEREKRIKEDPKCQEILAILDTENQNINY